MKQAHNLREARPADLAEPSQLGVVANGTAADQLLETESQSHQAGDARYSPRCRGRSLSRRRGRIRVPAWPLPRERTFDDWGTHGLLSLDAIGSFGARCRTAAWMEGNGYFVLRPVVIDTTDPEPHQAKPRAGGLGAHINMGVSGLDLLQHRLFDGPGGNRLGWTALAAAPVSAATEIVTIALAAMLGGVGVMA